METNTIQAINLAKLRNAEFFQFGSNVVTLITDGDAALKAEINKPFLPFKAAVDEIELLFKSQRGSTHTETLIALDARRDKAINGLVLHLESYTYHFNEAKVQAATLLLNHVKGYGTGIARQNYPTETATLTNIVNDWTNKPELAAAVATLAIGDWLAELDAANNAFNNKYLERAKEEGAETDDTIKEKRTVMADAYNYLVQMIVSYCSVKKDMGADVAAYQQLIGSINAIIEKFNGLLAARSKKDTPKTP